MFLLLLTTTQKKRHISERLKCPLLFLDSRQPRLPQLFEELCIELLVSIFLLLLLLSEIKVVAHFMIAGITWGRSPNV